MEYESTLPVAIITSALLLVLGCSMVFATRSWLALMAEYADHPHRMLVPGLAAAVYGLVVVFNHNLWEGGWLIAVSVAGWLILIKGLTFLLSPDVVLIHRRFSQNTVKMAMRFGGAVLILLSIMLLLTLTGRA